MNGFAYEGNNWAITAALLAIGMIHYGSKSMSFGYYKPDQYAQLVAEYIESCGLYEDEFSGFVLPGAAHFLPETIRSDVRHSESKTNLVKKIEARRRKRTIISTATAVPIFIVIAILVIQSNNGATGTTSNASPQVQQQLNTLQTTANNLKSQYSSCENQLSSQESSLNALNDQMNSYQTGGDATDYNNLVPQYNQDLANAKSKQSQCNSLYNQSNSAVDTYNNYLNQNQ